jgi:hypothetical protein
VVTTEQYGVDSRKLGGYYGVDRNAAILTRFRDAEFHSMLGQMAWLASVPEWEIKKQVGRFLHDDAQHADQLRTRLRELRRPPRRQLRSARQFTDFLWLVEQAPDHVSFLVGVYRVLKPKLISAYHHHIQRTDPVADEPTVRLLGRLIEDHERHIRYVDGAIQMTTMDPAVARRVSKWVDRLETAFVESGGLIIDPQVKVLEGDNETARLSAEAPYWTPPTVAARDPRRFRRCSHAEGITYVQGLSAREKMMWQWHQQSDNEMMAGELGSSSARENLDMPWEYFMDMARLTWDEVRHTEIFEKRLEEAGGYLGMYPVLPGNYAYRMSLDYPMRATDLHLMGEARGQLALLARRETHGIFGDHLSSKMFDYIHADEDKHVSFGRIWVTEHLLQNEQGKAKKILEEVLRHRDINGQVIGVPFVQKPTGETDEDDIANLLKELFPDKGAEYDRVSASLKDALKRPLD